jgi:hypothetical protein
LLKPGNANLLIGGLDDAYQVCGVPGPPQELDLIELRTYSSSERRRMIFQKNISEILNSRAAPEPGDTKLERKNR